MKIDHNDVGINFIDGKYTVAQGDDVPIILVDYTEYSQKEKGRIEDDTFEPGEYEIEIKETMIYSGCIYVYRSIKLPEETIKLIITALKNN